MKINLLFLIGLILITLSIRSYCQCQFDPQTNLFVKKGELCTCEEQSFYGNGIKKTVVYKNGQIINSKEVYPNGQLLTDIYYKDNFTDGVITSYYDNGGMKEYYEILNKVQEGPHIRLGENGQILSIWNYVNGKLNGNYLVWSLAGNNRIILQRYFSMGILDGDWKEWFDDNETGVLNKHFIYNKGRLTNVKVFNDLNGNPLDFGTLKEGTGTLKEYNYLSGEIIKVNYYVDGFKHGAEISFYNYPNDTLSIVEYKYGNINGMYKYFYKNNIIQESGTQKTINGNNDSIKRIGECRFYSEDGRLIKVETYDKDGKLLMIKGG